MVRLSFFPVICCFFSARNLLLKPYSSVVSFLLNPATSPTLFFCKASGDIPSLYKSNSLKNSAFPSEIVFFFFESILLILKTFKPSAVSPSLTISALLKPFLSEVHICPSRSPFCLCFKVDSAYSCINSGEASFASTLGCITFSPLRNLPGTLRAILAPRIPRIIPPA